MEYSKNTKTIFSQRLRYMMTIKNVRQKDLIEKLNIDKAKMSSYVNGRYLPNTETLKKICDFLECEIPWIIGVDENMQKAVRKIKVYSSIHAGVPSEMIDDVVDNEDITDYLSDKQYFGLKVKGDSMEPDFKENDTLICEQCNDVESGQIAVVVIEDSEAVLKKVIKAQNGIILYSLNEKYEPMVFSNNDNVKVIAKIVEIRRKL